MKTPSSGLRPVSLGIEIVGHHGAVRHRALGVELVEDGIEISGAGKLLLQFSFFVDEPFRMFGREIIVGIAEQGSRRGDQFGIVVARAQRRTGVGRRGHGIDVGVIGKSGVGMMIERRDVLDSLQEMLIELLHVGSGIGTGLGRTIEAECR